MMRRFLVVLCMGLVLALVLASAASAAPNQQLAAGTGTLVCCGSPMVHVNAQSDPGGLNPRGHFWIRYPSGAEFGGRVVCLSTAANTAGLTGHIEMVKVAGPSQGFVEGNYLTIRVTDMGEPGTADLVNFDPGTPTPPVSCAGVGDLPISQGNYVVHDDLVDLSAFNLLVSQFEAAAGDPYGTG
jgi:Desulfoferrodoxin, N-terminal domain